uniref:Ribonuclease 3 n=1 Tax=Phocoena sinus TaxID=42100 RepID=A0A8C9BKM6_PHOSS
TMQGSTCHRMSFHPGRGCPRGRGGHGSRPSAPAFRPQNLRLLHPQQPPVQYQYEPPSAPSTTFSNAPAPNFLPPRPDFVPFPPPMPPSAQGPLPPCPIRPPFPSHQMRPPFPVPPCFPPMPPPMPCPNNPPVPGAPPGQGTFPFMMPPPSMPHPPPPPVVPQQVNYQYPPGYSHHSFPPPNFNSFQNNLSSFSPSANNSSSPHFRHLPPYPLPKAPSERRSPERLKHYDDHRRRDHSHGRGERHRSLDRRERGRSPDRRRQDSRYRSDYDRGRTPSRHRSYERMQRPRHRPFLLISFSSRSYGLPGASEPAGCTPELSGEIIKNTDSWAPPPETLNHRSPSREKKRARWEEEKDRWGDNQSSGKEKNGSSVKEREPEESLPDRNEEDDDELLKPVWIRCTHSESYYSSDPMDQVGDSTVVGTSRLRDLYDKFEEELGSRQEKAKAARPPWEPPKTKLDEDLESSSESECESDEDSTCSSSSDSEVFDVIAEIKRKKAHPDRLHDELWYNDPGQMNDGPLCKCSAKARRTGIRHSIYPGEEAIKPCRPMTNNAGRLFHYRITVSPPTNFLTDRPTVIEYDDHEYIFEGFSMFAHAPLTNIPLCKVIRFNIDYTIHFIEEMMPENFCVKGLELFSLFLFRDILELYDWNLKGPLFEDSPPCCPRFHFMPRFVRFLPDGGKEVLSMHQILLYLLRCSKALVPEEEIANMLQWEELEWQKYAEECKGMIVTNPGTVCAGVDSQRLNHLPSLGLLQSRTNTKLTLLNRNLIWILEVKGFDFDLQEPNTDRQLIETSPVLQKLTEFEDAIGVIFTHVRLLARAFTLRTVGFNHLTLGHNQRMEFLGDSIMQLVATEYLFIHFPDHHEGHLTLLRSSLVNNRTQAKVAEELGMQEYAITNDKTKRPVALRTKTLADLLESFIAALYIDKDLEYVHTFMNVCFFPRLKEFILNQDWNDPKSQLQQCCLTLRTEGKEPDIPLYKTLQTVGPSHARTYTVAVYFKGERIGCGKGPSIQQAEMGAAMDALEKYNFPQMAHQKRFIERKYRQELKEMRWEREHQEKEPDETEDIKK